MGSDSFLLYAGIGRQDIVHLDRVREYISKLLKQPLQILVRVSPLDDNRCIEGSLNTNTATDYLIGG